MLKYRLISENEVEMIYAYYPEGKADHGKVSFNKETKEIKQLSLAECDEFRWYYSKIAKRIREFAQDGAFRSEGTIAWY